MEEKKSVAPVKDRNSGNKLLEGDDFLLIDGKLILTELYYEKRGLKMPKKNGNKN